MPEMTVLILCYEMPLNCAVAWALLVSARYVGGLQWQLYSSWHVEAMPILMGGGEAWR